MHSDIDLNRLKIFKEVAQTGSFTKAAGNLRLPKSRVSRQIAALEQELGIPLIIRTTRQFQLTEAGSELFRSAGPLLNQLRTTLEQIRSGSEELVGTIRLSVPDDIGVSLMGTVCQEFQAIHPKIRIDLHVGNALVDLIRDSYDLVVRVGKVRDSTMIQKRLATVGLSFYASPNLIGDSGYLKSMSDLSEYPYLAFSNRNMQSLTIKLRKDDRIQSVRIRPIFFSNNFFVLRQMAISGSGITTLPPFVARDCLKAGTLVPVLSGWQTEGGPVQILMPKQSEVPVRIRRFVDFLSQKLGKYFE